MAKILDGVPEDEFTTPAGIKTIRINRQTGEPASGDGTMLEMFIDGTEPEAAVRSSSSSSSNGNGVTVRSNEPKTKSQQKTEVESLF